MFTLIYNGYMLYLYSELERVRAREHTQTHTHTRKIDTSKELNSLDSYAKNWSHTLQRSQNKRSLTIHTAIRYFLPLLAHLSLRTLGYGIVCPPSISYAIHKIVLVKSAFSYIFYLL